MELITAYTAGDAEAFDELYERYRRQLYAYLNRLLSGNRSQADDVFQQTWIKAIANLKKYQDRELFLGWLMRIAHNLTVDMFRKGARKNEQAISETESEALESAAGSSASPAKAMDRQELADAIDSAVQELPGELREVFLLRQEDIPFREIAEIQNCSVNTCLARMRYALNALRSKLKDWNI